MTEWRALACLRARCLAPWISYQWRMSQHLEEPKQETTKYNERWHRGHLCIWVSLCKDVVSSFLEKKKQSLSAEGVLLPHEMERIFHLSGDYAPWRIFHWPFLINIRQHIFNILISPSQGACYTQRHFSLSFWWVRRTLVRLRADRVQDSVR